MSSERIDQRVLSERLTQEQGRRFWRSLDELAGSPAFEELLAREFPRGAAELGMAVNRRSFLKLMAASLGLAGLGACTSGPREPIVPYVEQPDPVIVPGQPLYFSTTMPFGGFGVGVLAESHMGRPTKIEGNPDHPASLGATGIFAQASVLELYDPTRAQAVLRYGEVSSWENFRTTLQGRMEALRAVGGAGLRILTETITSPTLAAQLEGLLGALPQARWHQYEPLGLDNLWAGAQLAFGSYVNSVYRFDQARRILALDADFLSSRPGHLRYARDFIQGRHVDRDGPAEMNRLYVAESSFSLTGAMADHRLGLRPSLIAPLARAIAQRLGVAGVTGEVPPGVPAGWVEALVSDLQGAAGAGIVIVGEGQPPEVHALAHAMNATLGNIGTTVIHTAPVAVQPGNQLASLRELSEAIAAGQVETLLIIEANPVLTAPADFDFAALLPQVPFAVHMSQFYEETSALCQWHLPLAHYLETWGDIRAYDGTVSLIQPLIEPLYEGRTAHELIDMLGDAGERSVYTIVRAYWQEQRSDEDFEQFWRRALRDGVVEGTALEPLDVNIAADLGATIGNGAAPAPQGLELVFRPDPTIWDGRFAGNAWLQELPKPLTSLTWDNPVLISPATALRLGLTSGDMVELVLAGRTQQVPVWVMPGQPDETVTLYLGYGRDAVVELARENESGFGFNFYPLRTSDMLWFGQGLELRPTGVRYELASVQEHFALEGRDLLRVGTLAEYQADPAFAQNEYDHTLPLYQSPEQGADELGLPTLLPEWDYEGYAWGMAIDLNACIGCHTCTIACQAENNIPVIGKEGVLQGRIMHWIKVDRYYEGNADNPEVYFQPRPCMHCEKAPCEVVCPVAATVHDAEGLNTMVYNRCIGTRYCSNNCPYKVRRFNFFDYNSNIPVINLVRNPQVTVRERGVMEKCTYCVQRIERARIEAKNSNRPIADGEVQPACAQACPTEAIVFGNINDPTSAVARLKSLPRNYGMLAELGTQPRTTYLARLYNPNPALEQGEVS